MAKAYFANAPVYINGTLGPSEIGYKTGSIKVEVSPETNEYTLTIDARDSYDIIYQENASAQVVYGSTHDLTVATGAQYIHSFDRLWFLQIGRAHV